MEEVPNPPSHQEIYSRMSPTIKENFKWHGVTQGISCIRLKPGVQPTFFEGMREAYPEEGNSMIMLLATKSIIESIPKSVWTCVRFSSNGYQSIIVYLGTSNIDKALRRAGAKCDKYNKK